MFYSYQNKKLIESKFRHYKSQLRRCLHGISFRAKWNYFILVSGANFLQLFTWCNPKINSLGVLSNCGHFDKNEISFGVIKYRKNSTSNEIIWKETSPHAFISSKLKWLVFTEWKEPSFHLRSNVMKANVNRISVMVGWIFISGRFHFGSHANFL